MKKKVLISIAMVLLVVLAAGVFVVQKKNVTKKDVQIQEKMPVQENNFDNLDWKTYTNDGWGYAIKYPSNLYIKSNTQGDKFPGDTESDVRLADGKVTAWEGGQTLIISDKEKMGIQDIMPDERIHIAISTFKANSNRYKGQTWGQYFDDPNNGLQKIQTDNFVIYEGAGDYSREARQFYRYVIKDGWVYDLSGGVYSGNKEISFDDFELIKKIILTFEFTK